MKANLRPLPEADGEARRQLTLGIVAEMSELVSGIAALSELHRQGVRRGPWLRAAFALIQVNCERLLILVQHLGKLNAADGPEAADLDLAATVAGLFAMFAPMLPKTLAVEVVPFHGELAVHLNESHLRRALLNLTLNLRASLSGNPGLYKLWAIVGRRAPDAARLTVWLTKAEAASEQPSGVSIRRDPAARRRLADARRWVGSMRGTLTSHRDGSYALDLPLAG